MMELKKRVLKEVQEKCNIKFDYYNYSDREDGRIIFLIKDDKQYYISYSIIEDDKLKSQEWIDWTLFNESGDSINFGYFVK